MSTIGLRFIAAMAGSKVQDWFALGAAEHLFEENTPERKAFVFMDDFARKHGVLPAPATVSEHCKVFLPEDPGEAPWLFSQLRERRVKKQIALAGDRLQQLMAANDPLGALDFMYSTSKDLRAEMASPSTVDFKQASSVLMPWLYDKWSGLRPSVPLPWPTFDQMTGGVYGGEMVSTIGRPGKGKALRNGEPVLLPDGSWQAIEALKIGDAVASVDGAPSVVTGVYPQGERALFEIEFGDGRIVEADGEHLWEVMYREWPAPRVKTTLEVQTLLTRRRYQGRLSIALCSGNFGDRKPSMDPYLLGVLLGDGCLRREVSFTTMDADIVDAVREALPPMHVVEPMASTTSGQATSYAIVSALSRAVGNNQVLNKLRSLGMNVGALEKHMPAEVFEWGRDDRWALLQGLLDTDGTISGNSVSFSTSSPRLRDDFRRLVWSLGGRCPVGEKATTHAPHWRMTVQVPGTRNPFRAHRKAKQFSPSQYAEGLRSIIKAVRPTAPDQATCISVSHPSRLFVTRDYVVTHNTWIQLYMAHSAWIALRRPIVFASQEIMARKLMERIAALHTHVTVDVMKDGLGGDFFGEKLQDKLSEGLFELSNSELPPFIILDGSLASTVEDIVAVCRRFNPAACYVDGAYLLKGPKNQRFGKGFEKIEYNCEALKQDIATDMDIPVFASWQFNREATKVKPGQEGLEHIAGGDTIGQLSSIVLGLLGENEDQKDNPETVSRRRIRYLKGRDGETGELFAHWDFKGMQFHEITNSSVEIHGI